MFVTRLTITDCDPVRLIGELQDRLEAHHAVVHEQVVVLITERFSLTESRLQSTIIMLLRDTSTCDVEIVTGGGGAGLLQVDYGAERRQNRRIVHGLEQICAEYGGTITSEQWP